MSDDAIPPSQRAWILPEPGQPLHFVKDHPVSSPSALQPGQCLVKLSHSGVCHSDLFMMKGYFSPPKKNLVGGHEGIGEVVAIGRGTANSKVKLDQRVGIKYVAESCLQDDCEQCIAGCDCCE